MLRHDASMQSVSLGFVAMDNIESVAGRITIAGKATVKREWRLETGRCEFYRDIYVVYYNYSFYSNQSRRFNVKTRFPD